MDVHEALAELKSHGPKPMYVVVGSESLLAERFLEAVRRAVLEGGVEGFNDDLFNGKGLDGQAVISTARIMPMMADRRLVRVRGLHAANAKELEPLTDYVAAPSDHACLLLQADKLDGRSKLVKAAKKAGFYIDASPLRANAIGGFIRAEAKTRGHAIEGAAVSSLQEIFGTDLSALDDAIERISLFVGPDQGITDASVRACIQNLKSESIWTLVDAIGRGDTRSILRASGSLLAEREPPLRILALVSRQLRMLLRMRAALKEGASPADAAKAAGAPPFKAQELARSCKRFGVRAFADGFGILEEADLALKSSKRPDALILEEALIRLAGLAQK